MNWFRPKLLLRGVVILAMVASTVAAYAAPAPTAPTVRVMSFNIRYGTARDGDNHWDKRKELLAETITTFDPDLLGTQETLASQRDYLAGQLPGYESFGAGRDDGKDTGEMAALFYRAARFEKLDGGHFWLSETPDQPGSKGWDTSLPRIATWVKLHDRADADAAPVFFLNTHFDHIGSQARIESARLIRKKIGELGAGCRIVVTGDFNAPEAGEPYAALFHDLDGMPSTVIDTFRKMYPEKTNQEGTISRFKPGQTAGPRIDWIACSRDWEVRLAGIDRTSRHGRTPSDHFPVTAVLRRTLQNQPPTLRVLSYNIHHGEGTDGRLDLMRLARLIRAADADLVALQEVDNKARRTDGIDQPAVLARLTGLHAAFGKAIDHDGGEYGQTILARFAPLDQAVHPLPHQPGNAAGNEQRIAFAARFVIHGQEISFVSTHLDHQDQQLRKRQAARLNELFGMSEHPVILAGDLNAEPASAELETLSHSWTSASAGKDLLTSPAAAPVRQIDYILFRPAESFQVREALVLDEPVASDHRPVLAVLECMLP